MDGDTAAVLEQGTAAPEVEQPLDAPESTTFEDAPETDALDAPETGTSDARPEDPEELDAWLEREAGRRAEAIAEAKAEALAASKVASIQESARRKAENEQYQRNMLATSEQGQAALENQFLLLAKDALDRGLEAPDRERLKAVVRSHQQVAEFIGFENITKHSEAFLQNAFPDFAIPQDLNAEYAQAQRARDPRGIAMAMNKIIATAAAHLAYAHAKAELAAEAEKEKKSAGVAANLRKEGAAREANSAARPTAGLATAASPRQQWKTQLQVDTALANREIDWATAKQLTAKGLPYS